MNILQPIQYQSQFIPMDLNVIQRGLDQRQQAYDASLSRIAAIEDQFGQMQVDPSDIEAKQRVFGDFRNKVDEIAERYGGDYGAASRDIARELTSFRNQPFMQLAPYKRQLIEEARQREAQLGVNKLDIGRGVDYLRGLDISSGELTPEQMQYEILNRQDVRNALKQDFGGLGTKTREYLLEQSGLPGFARARTAKGLIEGEVNQVTEDMFDYIKSINPNINDEDALYEASNYAKTLVQGYNDQFMKLPVDTGASSSNQNLASTVIARHGLATPTGWSDEEAKKMKDDYIKARDAYDAYKKSGDKDTRAYYTAAGTTTPKTNTLKQQYVSAIKPFKGDMFDDLIKNYGMTEEQAIDAVIKNNRSKMESANVVRASDYDVNESIGRALFNNRNAILKNADKIIRYNTQGKVDQPIGSDKKHNRNQVEDLLNEGMSKDGIKDIEFDLKDGSIVIKSKDYDYKLPMESLADVGVNKNVKNYKEIVNIMFGDKTASADNLYIGNNKFAVDKRYNPQSGMYEPMLYVYDIEGNKQPFGGYEKMGVLNKVLFQGLFDTYGTEAQYKKVERK